MEPKKNKGEKSYYQESKNSNSLYDENLSVNKKRNRIELFDKNEKTTESRGEETKLTKKVKADENPYTGRPYSERYYEILEQRKKLPAWEAKEQLAMLIKEFQVIILQGETGSGKTTQVPQFLLELLYKPGYYYYSQNSNSIVPEKESVLLSPEELLL
jgi:HrpA-like helicases